MKVFEGIEAIRKERWQNPTASWGFVPTMGYLHDGHLSLVRAAHAENDRVGVSIYVNPIQFNNPDDLTHYPRDLERDLALLNSADVDLVWTPTQTDVYPDGFQTYVDVQELSKPLEGPSRPGHFQGVATVVTKLLNVMQPTRAYLGEKDAQQLAVIRRMVIDLNMNTEIRGCPTIREKDGLAMSSRNALLTSEARAQAICLHKALERAQMAFHKGERRAPVLKREMQELIQNYPKAEIDYLSVADPATLQELNQVKQSALVSMAVFVDKVRLIDNIILSTTSKKKPGFYKKCAG